MPGIFRSCTIAILFLSLPSALHGSDTEKDLEKRLKPIYEGETFIIRHFYTGNHLKYDAEGDLTSKAESGSWTLYGFYEVKSLALKKNKMELEGKRLFWSYDSKEKCSRYVPSSGKTRIEIKRSEGSGDTESLQGALLKICMSNDASLQDAVPYYWKYFVTKEFGNKNNAVEGNPIQRSHPRRTGGYVDPKAISQPLPPYTSVAKTVNHSGEVRITATVNKEGRVVVKDIIAPLGLGLDESAVDTISKKWKFVPASQHGVPVDCEVDIMVEFNYYP